MTTLKQLKPVLNSLKSKCRPILNNVYVENGKMVMTDMETTLEVNDCFNLEEGFHAIETLGLIGANKEISKDDYPLIDFTFDYPVDQFKWSQNSIESFLPFTSNDETRIFLNGIAVNDGHLVATTGHILKYEKIDNDITSNYIMPRTSLKILNNLLKKFKVKEDITIKLNEGYMLTKNEYFTFKCRLIQRDYPKWLAVVPTKYAHEFVIDNKLDVKELKPLFNPRTNGIKITLLSGKVFAAISGYDQNYLIGHCDEDLDFTIGVNAMYLDTCLNGSNISVVKFNNGLSPMLANNNIVMPLKI